MSGGAADRSQRQNELRSEKEHVRLEAVLEQSLAELEPKCLEIATVSRHKRRLLVSLGKNVILALLTALASV